MGDPSGLVPSEPNCFQEPLVKADCSRREWLVSASTAAGTLAAPAAAGAKEERGKEPFGYCLNTSTLRGHKLKLVQEIDIASRAGYQGIEPWLREIDEYIKGGGSLKDLSKRLRDSGLRVESSIAFFEWIVDDEAQRKKGFEEARRSMDWVRQIGGRRIAAPPAGATNQSDLNLLRASERYRTLLELGDRMDVVPQVEVWGFSRTLGRLGEAVQVAMESGHPRACVLADVFHLYKGGSGFTGIGLLGSSALHVLHLNDYPADPPRATIRDADRVYPGDGVAPLKTLLRELRRIGFRGMLSLELFNPVYWNQDAVQVARTGLEKMRTVVQSSLE
jgi:sugar phosphate isomerase/epimerase